MSTRTEVVTPSLLRAWPLPEPGDSKRSRGQVLIIGGSSSTPGAVMLSGLASLRVGAGVLTFGAPRSVSIAIATAIPECGVTGFEGSATACWSDALTAVTRASDAVLIGPGLGDVAVAAALIEGVNKQLGNASLALDAYALGALASRAQLLSGELPLVLTPNRDEAARLLDTAVSDLGPNEAEVASEIARRWQACVSYQGIVADRAGQLWDVPSGHPGLGTSGSGDVLAGAVVGLLARGSEPSQSAVWATYLHATAGDRLASRIGPLGYLARELIDELPSILAELNS